MNGKTALQLVQIFLGIVGIPVMMYGSWLMYKHVQATDLMWFVLVISWIVNILSSILTAAINTIKESK